MNAQQLLNEILPILYSVKENNEKLQQIFDFLLKEIYEKPEEKEPDVPEKYRPLIHTLAEKIDCGLVCYINTKTLEVEALPKGIFDGYSDFSLNSEFEEEDEDEDKEKLLHDDWESYITIEPRESSESFGIMEKFTDKVNDNILKNKLVNALNNRKPFANFKNIVENSKYRTTWYTFKQQQLEIMVWDELRPELENPENIN